MYSLATLPFFVDDEMVSKACVQRASTTCWLRIYGLGEAMSYSIRTGTLVLIGLMLGGCNSLESLFDEPAPIERPAPVAPAVPLPDDSFCRSYADQRARPPMMPNLYTIQAQTQIRASEFATCMSWEAAR
jgi:hypothetical protein